VLRTTTATTKAREPWELATRYWKNRCVVVGYFLFCLFCMPPQPPAAWEAECARVYAIPPCRLFSFSLVRVVVLFMRLWCVKADDAARGERIGAAGLDLMKFALN
jgi:hypothetical protein